MTWADEATTSACIVLNIAGTKAIEVAGYYNLRCGYLYLRKDQWLEIDPEYNDYYIHPEAYINNFDWPGYLTHRVEPPSALQAEIDATFEVLSTLRGGIIVSHETARQWARKFGQQFANQIRRRLPRVGDKWHLDEVVLKIAG